MRITTQFSPILPIPRRIKKLYKKVVEHNLGYRPIIEIYCERIKGEKEHPFFDFHASYIWENYFYFYHEKYQKDEFKFIYRIYENQDPIFIKQASV